jgi:hypothetical protein
MQRRQGASDVRIAQSGQPVGAVLRQRFKVVADDVDEEQFAEAPEHHFAADARVLRLGDRKLDELRQRTFRTRALVDDARQRREQRVEGTVVAAEEAAHDLRRFMAGRTHRQREGKAAPLARRLVEADLRCAAHSRFARKHVRIAMGEHDDVACLQLHGWCVDQTAPARSRCDDVVGHQVVGGRKDPAHDSVATRRFSHPRRRGFYVEEDRARQANRPQDVR